VVRWIYNGQHHKHSPLEAETLAAISQKLAAHHIGFSVEWLNASRIQAVHQAGQRPHEMLGFNALPLKYQKLFSDFQNVLLNGLPTRGIRLPYISVDLFAAVRP
jgi:hypothetical protein